MVVQNPSGHRQFAWRHLLLAADTAISIIHAPKKFASSFLFATKQVAFFPLQAVMAVCWGGFQKARPASDGEGEVEPEVAGCIVMLAVSAFTPADCSMTCHTAVNIMPRPLLFFSFIRLSAVFSSLADDEALFQAGAAAVLRRLSVLR